MPRICSIRRVFGSFSTAVVWKTGGYSKGKARRLGCTEATAPEEVEVLLPPGVARAGGECEDCEGDPRRHSAGVLHLGVWLRPSRRWP